MPIRLPSTKLMMSEVKPSSRVQTRPIMITLVTGVGKYMYEMPKSPWNRCPR